MERLFNLDFQLLHDSYILAISVFVFFLFLSYLFLNPAKSFAGSKDEIARDIANAKTDKEEAGKAQSRVRGKA